jgi:glycosyltransferase involved in cell wall biosynthesis
VQSIAVIMPAYNAAAHLERSLPPLMSLLAQGDVSEVIVVDDCSTDATAGMAQGHGARVLRTPRNCGPGGARNLAAKEAKSEILWFVDADVVAHADGPRQIRAALSEPSVCAVFGSYDDAPPAQGFAAQYKNLTHRYYHQRARQEASTFWAGCGAVRRVDFLEVGGFDVERFPLPSIEDIELGHRLRARGGRIRLVPSLQGTHLKPWTMGEVVRVDLFRRALPWARLMIREAGMADDLNVSVAERLRAGLAGLLVLSLVAALGMPALWWLLAAAAIAVFIANNAYFTYMRARRGLGFALRSLLFHQLYYLYSASAFVYCLIEHWLGPHADSSALRRN